MRKWNAWAAQFPKLAAGHGGSGAVRRVLTEGDAPIRVIHDTSGWDNPNRCSNYYGMDTGADCVPARSAVVYLVTGVAGMALLLALTVFFICCLCLRKRRREQAESAFLRWQQAQTVQYPVGGAGFVGGQPQGNLDSRPGELPMGVMEGKNPSVCVIMAGDDKPTFLAHPMGTGTDLPMSEGPKQAEETGHRVSKSPG